MKTQNLPFSLKRLAALAGLATTLVLSGCGGSSDSGSLTPPVTSLSNAGVVASASSDFQSGGVNVIDLDSANYDITGPYHETGSDIAVVGGSGHYYLLEKFGVDVISKIDLSNPARKTWDEFSTLLPGEMDTSNPYDLIKVNDQKAYLLRYNSPKILIVNPSATNEADFKTGKFLDLSAYTPANNPVNGSPQVSAATIVNGKLFVTLARLEQNGFDQQPTNTGYVAVFDVANDEEIDTDEDTSSANLKGIPLLGTNPADVQYHDNIGLVVKNLGTNFPTYGEGSSLDIINIDNNKYAISSLIPVRQTAADGQIKDFVIVNGNLGYVINLTGYDTNFNAVTSVQSFVPDDRTAIFTSVGNLSGGDYRDIELSPKGNLWVADANLANPGIWIIDPANNAELAFVESLEGLLPNNIAFVTK